MAAAARVTPGDRIVYQLSYRNSGREPARDLVIANPVPANMAYAGAAEGSAEPELSVDGTRFGSLAQPHRPRSRRPPFRPALALRRPGRPLAPRHARRRRRVRARSPSSRRSEVKPSIYLI